MRRYSFSRPKHRSTTLRLQYASRSSCARPSDAIFSFDFRGITAFIPLFFSSLRNARPEYALSASTACPRRFMLPFWRWTPIPSRSRCANWLSWAYPGLSTIFNGRPLPSVARWILVPKPPRERPGPLSPSISGCFFEHRRHISAPGYYCHPARWQTSQ